MKTELLTHTAQLGEIATDWEALPRPSPMQSPHWLIPWWGVFANSTRQLAVVTVRNDSGNLIGLAPWYVQDDRAGRCLRFLGDGTACSDHATLLWAGPDLPTVVDALADWVLNASPAQWRLLYLEEVDHDDLAMGRFVTRLASARQLISSREGVGSCYADLPATWETFLTGVSKNHRKRCRRWEREFFDSQRVTVTVAKSPDDCRTVWHELVALHNERRNSLGESGAFEDQQFRAFHDQAVLRLAAADQLQMRVLRHNGIPVAAEYVLQDQGTLYAYQSGMSRQGIDLAAGNLSVLALVRDAIATGRCRLDLLRGDEPYKFSWSAKRRPTQTIVVRRGSATGHLGTWCDLAWNHAKQARRRFTTPN